MSKFKYWMNKILSINYTCKSPNIDATADVMMLYAAHDSMRVRLNDARTSGRHGWWDEDVCSIDDLYRMRDKAITDKDHVSVMNFTAMIAMRESFKPDSQANPYTIDELFSTPDMWARLHDVMVECDMGSPTMEQARQVFGELPEEIKQVAFEWGICDTVFGDKAYEHLKSIGE